MNNKQLAIDSAAGRIGRAVEQAQIDFQLGDAEVLKILAREIAYRSRLLDGRDVAKDSAALTTSYGTAG